MIDTNLEFKKSQLRLEIAILKYNMIENITSDYKRQILNYLQQSLIEKEIMLKKLNTTLTAAEMQRYL